MKISHKTKHQDHSYPLNSVLCTLVFLIIRLLEPKFTIVLGLSVFGTGLLAFIYFWAYLTLKTGICPGLYHSTLCRTLMKQDKIYFKSSHVLEYGILNGICDTLLFFCLAQASHTYFTIGLNVLSAISLIILSEKYFCTDFIGISLISAGTLLLNNYSKYDLTLLYDLAILALSIRIIIYRKHTDKISEVRSISLTSIMVDGILITSTSFFLYFYSDPIYFGSSQDILIGLLYSLASYFYLNSSIYEKSSVFLSLFSFQTYYFQLAPTLSLFSSVLSISGLSLSLSGLIILISKYLL